MTDNNSDSIGARCDDLQLALDLALAILGAQEPGDSRAVSNEFVAMASIACDIKDRREECRQIIRDAIADIQTKPEGSR